VKDIDRVGTDSQMTEVCTKMQLRIL